MLGEVSGATLKRGVYVGRSRSRFQRTRMSLNSNVAVNRPHIVINYCLFIQTINMAIAIAPATTFLLLPAPAPGAKTFLKGVAKMRFLHTMLRVRDLDEAMHFYCNLLGLEEVRRRVDEKNKYTLVFLARPRTRRCQEELPKAGATQPMVELTYNWDTEDYGEARYFGHLAYEVDDIYATCEKLHEGRRHHQPAAARRQHGVRALARQAFDRAAAEGQALPPKEPWASMPNTGKW